VVAVEAQAAGLPVVVPDAGVFPEMLSTTRGGVLYRQGDSKDLASALGRLMDDPEGTAAMARTGAQAVAVHYSADRMVEDTLEAFATAFAT
jgi:glycosyltransferase involved in cell wall biosynthesis